MRRIVVLVTAGCLGLGTLGAAGSAGAVTATGARGTSPGATTVPAAATSAAAAPSAGPITWAPCQGAALAQAGAECGSLAVPLDHSKPQGAKITLALSLVRHTSPASTYQGVMLVNPGGPGASGLNLALIGADVPQHAGATYDWIGFDPRGVGASKPALSCVPGYFGPSRPPYIPVTAALERTWRDRSAGYASACEKNATTLLPHMKTRDNAQDMDDIRAALGAPKLSFYGFSYGTYLGQVYASLYPSRVRRMVLDSNVDPRYVWYQANLKQDTAFELTMGKWFAWLAKFESTYQLGGTADEVRQLFYEQETTLQKHPAGGKVGPAEWDDAFLLAGYAQSTWPGLGQAFASWVHQHDATQLVAAWEDTDTPGNDNGFAVYNAVQCTDAPWPRSWSTWADDAWRTDRVAPFVTWQNTWFNAPCLTWPVRAGTPVTVSGGSTSALLIDETLDAATPFEGSLEVRRRFTHASLIAEPGGTTHAGSLLGNACVDDKIAAYLATGVLPVRRAGDQPDAECAPLPAPVPGSATPARAPLPSLSVPGRAARQPVS